MLSISNVQNSAGAANYYEAKDDYYSATGRESGVWFGSAAAALGLAGAVNHSAFAELLEGKLPNGSSIHRAAGGHRGGTDLTFSAPKTVSLMALLGGDERVMIAHSIAVNRALQRAQAKAGFRVTVDGVTTHQTSGNLLVAQFTHELSRACDPQLHTHCVVLNASQRPDGQWRALDNEPLYRAKMLLGAIYRAELARELQDLGYEIRVTHPDGRFELADFDSQVVRAFSQRSQAMEIHLAAKGDRTAGYSAVEKKQAALATRLNKADVDRDLMAEVWGARLAELGAKMPPLPNLQLEGPDAAALFAGAASSIDGAIKHLSERQSTFTRDQLAQVALQFGVGQTGLREVITQLATLEAAGTLVASGEMLTTRGLQQEELDLLAAEKAERCQLPRLLSNGLQQLSNSTLSMEQAAAVHHVVSINSRVIGVVGKAGTGKTTALATAVKALSAGGIKIMGAAPSSAASRLLAEAGLQTATVPAFIHNKMGATLGRGGVLIIDEAGMLSTKQMTALMLSAKENDFRLVLVGDPAQLASVEAGKPFAQLLESGLPSASLREVHRQRDPSLKEAVVLASTGRIDAAITAMRQYIKEVPARAERLEVVASTYVALSASQRAETIVVAGTRTSREQINQLIRGKLGLPKEGMSVRTLERKDLTRQLALSITAYDIGDIVVADRDYTSLGLRRGDQAEVADITSSRVVLLLGDRRVLWSPALQPGLSAYRVADRTLAAGDKICITSNLHACGLLNGDQLRILAVDQAEQTFTAVLPNGNVKKLSSAPPLPLDYAYCRTVYASQGATCERVLIEADTASLTSNQATFYVALSRARSEVIIFTDDAENLSPAMSRNLQKGSALDIEVTPGFDGCFA